VQEGNRLYQQQKYDEAIQKYHQATEQSPDSGIASFNLGDALFKKGNYKDSVDAFTRALNTDDLKLEADAAYNIANAKYKLGNELSDSDLNSAAGLYRESLDYYKRAIELNEKDTDAKYNHELVEKELNVLLEKLKDQPQKQQQEQDRKEEDKEDRQEQSKQEQSGRDKEDDQQQGNRQQEKKEGPDRQEADKERDMEGAPGQKEEQTGEMSPEEARMLLDAFADEEAMENAKKRKRGYDATVLKDW
jgi:tetratricopeptide (TPR) repeat protein